MCCYSTAFASPSRSRISLLLAVLCLVASNVLLFIECYSSVWTMDNFGGGCFKEVMMDRSKQLKLCVGYYWIMRMQIDTLMLLFLVTLYMYIRNRRRGHSLIGQKVNTLPLRRDALDNIELRLSLNSFATLCELLQVQGGLDEDGHVGIGEQVTTFLIILAHHAKNRALQVRFYRSGETISSIFTSILFAKADPVPEDCVDPRWKWFKGCLGALDGTYIDVTCNTPIGLSFPSRLAILKEEKKEGT
ncbi:hypothetical protein Ahy_A01g002633 [Arachis hypogaea]|uniref:DUF8040 domain-containing protein n=1 Tax=Arachis hypogaea TaxID=3818 RepID=A0A445ER27_ARAHY|nr:hypothetical protein Ahy_A01g002633 [Arachis hypogaea]